MKKVILSTLLALSLGGTIVEAKPTKGYNTMDSMGCMMLRECTDGVFKINSLLDISSELSLIHI